MVRAGGSAEGSIACGNQIALSASAPTIGTSFESFGGFDAYYGYGYGFYPGSGNIQLTGVGVNSETTFTGDVIDGRLPIDPVVANIDCLTNTLVIVIESAADVGPVSEGSIAAVLNNPGSGTVSLE